MGVDCARGSATVLMGWDEFVDWARWSGLPVEGARELVSRERGAHDKRV
jgi:hypothetical protein